MKKRNLQPTQTAPVERDNTATSRHGEKGVNPSINAYDNAGNWHPFPFAGDDAE